MTILVFPFLLIIVFFSSYYDGHNDSENKEEGHVVVSLYAFLFVCLVVFVLVDEPRLLLPKNLFKILLKTVCVSKAIL